MLYYYSNELEVNVITGSLALESLFLILTFTLKLTSEEKVLKSQRHDFTFLTVNVPFIRQFIVILGLMPITVILWREHSCWRKNYSNTWMLLLGWSHRTFYGCYHELVRKKHFSNGNWFFPFYVNFFPLSSRRLLPDLTMWATLLLSYKKT